MALEKEIQIPFLDFVTLLTPPRNVYHLATLTSFSNLKGFLDTLLSPYSSFSRCMNTYIRCMTEADSILKQAYIDNLIAKMGKLRDHNGRAKHMKTKTFLFFISYI